MSLRSFLFIPADSEKKLAKGPESGADALILDLEDSVAPARKQAARALLAETLAAPAGGPQRWARINPLDEGGVADLAAIVRPGLAGIVLPKVSGAPDMLRLSHMLDVLEARDGIPPGTIRVLPIATETAAAAFGLHSFAPHPRLLGLTWGAEDLATALGAATNQAPSGGYAFTYRLVRSLCLLAARAAAAEPIDSVYTDFRDDAGLRAECEESAREGFTGRMAIHPAQVDAINRAYTPSAEDVAHATRVIEAFAAQPGAGVVAIDGKMVDIPHLKQARRLLARAHT